MSRIRGLGRDRRAIVRLPMPLPDGAREALVVQVEATSRRVAPVAWSQWVGRSLPLPAPPVARFQDLGQHAFEVARLTVEGAGTEELRKVAAPVAADKARECLLRAPRLPLGQALEGKRLAVARFWSRVRPLWLAGGVSLLSGLTTLYSI